MGCRAASPAPQTAEILTCSEATRGNISIYPIPNCFLLSQQIAYTFIIILTTYRTCHMGS